MDGALGVEDFCGFHPALDPNGGVEQTFICEYLGCLTLGFWPASPERGMCLGGS